MRTLTKGLIVAGATVALLWGVLHVNAKELGIAPTPEELCSAPVVIAGVKGIKVTDDKTHKTRMIITNIDKIIGILEDGVLKCGGHAITNLGEFNIYWMVTTDRDNNLHYQVKVIPE